MASQKAIKINVPVLARVEGEGALDLTIQDGQISELRLRIFEPPRYFEKFAEGRDYFEIPDLVARICGICPVAYQMSAVHAIESILQLETDAWIHDMRRVLYCGEWIESHNLHIHLLAAPDFFGYNNAMELAKDYPEIVKRGVYLQELGNELIKMFGGRSVHPVGVRVGGFYRSPSLAQVQQILTKLQQALPQVEELVRWTAAIPLPEIEQQFNYVSVQHETEYPMNKGNIVSSTGLNINISEYNQYFKEFHVPHSTALHSLLQDEPYLLGPLARVNLNFAQLHAEVKANLALTAIQFPSHNMFHSIVARAVEVHYAFVEAIRLLSDYRPSSQPYVEVKQLQAGTGFGCTEAPRGMLWHQWSLDEQGLVAAVQIVPPTSQNQAQIEQDLRIALQQKGLDKPADELRLFAETIIRNYDPCISCATHFLRLNIK
jgi:sulfhydrogenase subunit alpha